MNSASHDAAHIEDHVTPGTEAPDGEDNAKSRADPKVLADIVSIEYESFLLGKRLTRVAGFRDPQLGILDRSAYILLVSLEHAPLSIGELSAITGLETSTLNRQTAAMRREGLINRIADPDGGMARKFIISSEGSTRLTQQRHRNLGALRTVLADWSDEDISQFAASLTRFNRSIYGHVAVRHAQSTSEATSSQASHQKASLR